MPVLPLVGREQELKELREAASAFGGLVLLGGEAGIGKSAILDKFCRDSGLPFVVGRCPGQAETPLFGPWLEAVAQATDELEGDRAGLPEPFGTAPPRPGLSDIGSDLLRWLSGVRPRLIVALEDIHWADRSSLDLLQLIAPRLSRTRVLVVVTYRTDELHRGHPLWPLLPELGRSGAHRLLLGRLGEEHVAALAAVALGDDQPTRALAGQIYKRTDGHPLFVRDLLEAARFAPLQADQTGLPETVQQAIDQRLAHLGPGAREVLQGAAVLGERFDYDALCQVAEVGEEPVAQVLEQAVARHIVRPLGAASHRFAFDHALVREVLLQPLIGPRLRRLHGRAAEALLSGRDPDPGAVALHLDHAGDPRAVEFLIAAGDRSLAAGALRQAELHFDRALALMAEDDFRRAETLVKLSRSAEAHSERARACLEDARRAAEAVGDEVAGVLARTLELARQVRHHESRWLEPLKEVEEAHERLRENPRLRRLDALLYGGWCGYPRPAAARASLLTSLGRTDEASVLIENLKARAVSGPWHGELETAQWRLLSAVGRFREAVGIIREQTAARRRVRNYRAWRTGELILLTTLLHYHIERPEAADEQLRLAIQACRETDEWSGPSRSESGRGTWMYAYFRGDWDLVRREVAAELAAGGEVGATDRRMAAAVLCGSGEAVTARQLMAPVEPVRPEIPAVHPWNLMARAEVCLALGDPEQALAWAMSATRSTDSRLAIGAEFVSLVQAECLFRLGQRPDAIQLAESAVALGEQRAAIPCLTRAHLLLGTMLAGDQPGRAEGHLRQSVEWAQRGLIPYQEALALVALGRYFGAAPGVRPGLERARGILAKLGAAPSLAEAEALLATSPAKQAGLTERELSVVRLVAQGLTDKEVGARLRISPRTVDGHLRNIFGKLDVASRAALAALAAKNGLV